MGVTVNGGVEKGDLSPARHRRRWVLSWTICATGWEAPTSSLLSQRSPATRTRTLGRVMLVQAPASPPGPRTRMGIGRSLRMRSPSLPKSHSTMVQTLTSELRRSSPSKAALSKALARSCSQSYFFWLLGQYPFLQRAEMLAFDDV